MKQSILNIYYTFLGYLARSYIKKTKPYIIGINGSVGKTSCRMIVTQTLQQLLPHRSIYTSPKNFNGELGMSLSIFEIEKYSPSIIGMLKVLVIAIKKLRITNYELQKVLVLEYGIDHPGEMDFLLTICKPHISIHTQIDAVHSMQFGNPDNIAKEEFLLQQQTLETVFLNIEDPYISHVQGTIPCDIISYSATNQKDSMIHIIKSMVHNENNAIQTAQVIYNGKKTVSLGINLLGDYHLSYAAIGICIADILSYKSTQQPAVIEGQDILLTLTLQPGRRSVFDGIHDSIVIDSSYNASPRSVKHILQEVNERRNHIHPTYKLLFVLGDMRELGSQESKEHTELAEYLQGYDASVFLIGNVMGNIVEPYFEIHGPGRLQNIMHFSNYQEVGSYLQSYLLEHNHEKYIIVFKGSQNTIFLEEAVKYVLLHTDDETKLPRQGDRWATKKQQFLTNSLQQKGV